MYVYIQVSGIILWWNTTYALEYRDACEYSIANVVLCHCTAYARLQLFLASYLLSLYILNYGCFSLRTSCLTVAGLLLRTFVNWSGYWMVVCCLSCVLCNYTSAKLAFCVWSHLHFVWSPAACPLCCAYTHALWLKFEPSLPRKTESKRQFCILELQEEVCEHL